MKYNKIAVKAKNKKDGSDRRLPNRPTGENQITPIR